MSTPEDPTRRLAPEPPPPPRHPYPHERAVVEEEVVTGPDRLDMLMDDLRSLRTALILTGLLALAALGVGLWALLTNDDDEGTRDGLRARVSQLDERVEELEQRQRRASEESDVARLQRQLEQTRQAAQAARASAASAAGANEQLRGQLSDLAEQNEQLAEQNTQLAGRIDQLSDAVDELRDRPAP